MNKLEYYTRKKDPWNNKEIEDIKREYDLNTMTISEIADIHRRTPGSISYKLKGLGIISHNTLARGYLEYKKSDLYQEIVKANKIEDAAKVKKKEGKIISKIESKYAIKNLKTDISDNVLTEIYNLKDEIKSLKKDVKEVLRLMNEIYVFETQNEDS